MSFARGLGVTFYTPERVYNGFTLFTPCSGDPGTTWLIDMQGRFVHRWQLPDVVRLHAELLPTGNLLAGISQGKPKALEVIASSEAEQPQSPDQPKKHIKSLWAGGQVVELDWDGNVVWKYADPYLNTHDRVRMKNGNTLIHKYVPVPKGLQAKVKGGFPESDEDTMWGDALQEITPDGKIAWEWVAHEHMDPELDSLHHMAPRCLWSVSNTLVELPDGNIMISCQFLSRIYIIDKATGAIKWRWGQPEITFQHQPTLLDNGNILLLDNRRWIPYAGAGYSRVIEVNPNTNEIEWEYVAENSYEFFTVIQGGCQRLPNGNTLICQAVSGRIFEVTPKGDTVWEYINPFYDWHPLNPAFGRTNLIHRAYRYGPDYPGLHGKKLDPKGKLDLWNRLYGPESWGALTGSSQRQTGETETKVDSAGPETAVPATAFKSSAPSVAPPSVRGKKTRSRLESLGY